MNPKINVAIYGASGHTGQLLAAELVHRGYVPLLVGRDKTALEQVATGLAGKALIAVADVDDPLTLDATLMGIDVLINCAGPQSDTAYPLAAAAIGRGVHYLDTNAVEQLTAKRLFDELSDAARMGHVVVVPGLATFGGLGDMLASQAARGLDSIAEVTVSYIVRGWIPTRGSQATARKAQGTPRLIFSEGRFSTNVDPPSIDSFDFGPHYGVLDVIKNYPDVAVATIPRHVPTQQVAVQMTVSTVQEFRSQDPEEAATAAAHLRKQTEFVVVVDVRHGSGRKRLTARGTDIYGFTAIMMATAVERMGRGFDKAGVLSPSEAFDPAEFLDALARRELDIQVG